MTGTLDDAEIEISCGNCGSRTKKSIGWMKDHNEFECGCGTMILVDASKFRKARVRTESGLDGSRGLAQKPGKQNHGLSFAQEA